MVLSATTETMWTLRVVEAMIIHAQAWLDDMWTRLPIELIREVDTLCIDLALLQDRIEKELAGDCVTMEASLEELITQYKELKERTLMSYVSRGEGLGLIEGVEEPLGPIE
jgi:hypothetical protein